MCTFHWAASICIPETTSLTSLRKTGRCTAEWCRWMIYQSPTALRGSSWARATTAKPTTTTSLCSNWPLLLFLTVSQNFVTVKFQSHIPTFKNLKSPAQFQLFDIYVDSFMSNGIRIREGQVVNCSSNLSFPSEIIFQSNTNKKTTLCCRTDAEHDWVFFLLLSFSCNQI